MERVGKEAEGKVPSPLPPSPGDLWPQEAGAVLSGGAAVCPAQCCQSHLEVRVASHPLLDTQRVTRASGLSGMKPELSCPSWLRASVSSH